jgi:molybdate transport system substrate-binding protein
MFIKIITIIIFLYIKISLAQYNSLNIAVSSNFYTTAKIICNEFEKLTGYRIILTTDSTANIFFKIKNGANINIFISADIKHNEIIKDLFKIQNNIIIYAQGKIAFLYKKGIKKNFFKYIEEINNFSISNYNLTPYGYESFRTIKNINLKKPVTIILGNNISQTFHFIYTNNVSIGIVALSQIKNSYNNKIYFTIPKYLYKELNQSILLLKNSIIGEVFIEFFETKYTKSIIKKNGYKIK